MSTRKFDFSEWWYHCICSLGQACKNSIQYPVSSVRCPASRIRGCISGTLCRDPHGAALVIVLIISVLLSALGIGALTAANTEIKIADNYKMRISATECAYAGIAEAARKLVNKKIVGNGNVEWRCSSGAIGYNNTYTVSYVTVEDGEGDKKMVFDEHGEPYYQVDSTGILINSGGEIKKRAIIKLKKQPLFEFACFGNRLIKYKNASIIDSYDSRRGNYKMSASKSGGFLGGNGDIIFKNGSVVRGNIRLGKDALGIQGTLTSTDIMVTGDIGATDRIDPNPLGRQLDIYMDSAIRTNDNFGIPATHLKGYDLEITQGVSIDLAGGRYYFSDMLLKRGSVLKIAGTVTIFLNGGLYMGSNAQIMTTSGKPADLIIFSNSTEDIVIDNTHDFCGCIYAPRARVILKNRGDFYGAFWADEVINHNGNAFHYDEAIGDKFTTGDYTGFELVSLREVY